MNTTDAGEILRSVPEGIGYIDAQLFDDLGFVQTVVAGGTIYVSGIAPLTGGSAGLEPVGSTFAAQLDYTLEVLDKSLQAVGANRCDLVAWTIYTTDMAELVAAAPILKDWVGAHRPTSTWVTVAGLIHPLQKLELTATAVR